MANIRFVKAPNDNRVRPVSDAAKANLNYNSPFTPDNSAHVSAVRCDAATPKTRPNNDTGHTASQNLFVTCNNNNSNNESTPCPAPRVATNSSKKDNRDNNYTGNSSKMSKRQSFNEGSPASALEKNDDENEKCVKVNEKLKYVANKSEQNVVSRTSGDESNKAAKIKLEHTKRKQGDHELNLTQMKGAKETQDITTKAERKDKESDVMPEICKSGNLTSQSGMQQSQQQEQQKPKRQEEKQSATYPPHSHQDANRQATGNTAQQFKSQAGNRTLCRSISEAEITDEPSFFRSISDVKYYGLDSEDTDTINMTGNSKEKRVLSEATGDYRSNSKHQEEMNTGRQDEVSTYGLDSSKSKTKCKAENEGNFNVEKSDTIKQSTLNSPASFRQDNKTARQDGVSKSGLDSSSKRKAENESTLNVKKNETIKQNNPEEKKASMTQEKKTDTLGGSTGSTLAVVKSKISEAIKTGFKKLDNMDEKTMKEPNDQKVNTVAGKTGGTFDDVQSNTVSVSHSKISQERNVSVTQNKVSQEKNVGVAQCKTADKVGVTKDKINEHKNFGAASSDMVDDKKLGMAQNKLLGEKKADVTNDKISEDRLGMTQGKLADCKKSDVAQRKMLEDKPGTTQSKIADDKRLGVTKTNVSDEKKSISPGEKKANMLEDNKCTNDNNILDGTKSKLSEEKKSGMTKRNTIEDNMCHVLKEKDLYSLADNKINMFEVNRSNAMGTQVNLSEGKNVTGTPDKIYAKKGLVATQDKISEEKTQGKSLKEIISYKTQGKMSVGTTTDTTQSKPLEDKKVGGVHNRTSEDEKLVKPQSKISEGNKVGVAQGKVSEDKKLAATQSKTPDDKKSNAKQIEVSDQTKVGVTQGQIAGEKICGATLEKIVEDKKLGVLPGKLPEDNILGNISEDKKFSMQEKTSENKKMTKHCELQQDQKFNTAAETKSHTFVDKKTGSLGENKTLTANEKYHNVRDAKEVAVVKGNMSEDKKLRETKGKMSEDKKVDVTAGKVLEDKKLVATKSKLLNDNKLGVTQASKLEERKGDISEKKKLRDSKDSSLDAKKNKLTDAMKADSMEGAKSKTVKKHKGARQDQGKGAILNETTSKILEQRKNAKKQQLLDEEYNVTGQRGNALKEVNSAQRKASVTSEQDTTISSTVLDDMSPADRLKLRRSALSNPEKMIMSQEQREKIEKDVEKTKGSMARKVSLFLNVQLGLNKEEDLI